MRFPGAVRTKLPKQGTTIFSVMSALAREHGAINLSQGFPDFAMPDRLIDLTVKHMRSGHNQYAPMQGLVSLREALARKIETLYSASYNPDTEITVTAGATQAIFTAITALVGEGDEVIVLEPAYDCYVPAIELAGGVPVFVPMDLRGPNVVDWERLKKLVNQRTRMIIINTPHNPSGRVFTAEDMAKLQRITDRSDIIILSDEVYEHILFDGMEHQSVARFPKLAERALIVSSFGKTYHNTGWKVGYIAGPDELMREFRKTHQFNVFSVNTPVQHALADYLNEPQHFEALSGFYQQKRDLFASLIKGSRFKLRPSAGTYFQLLDFADISTEKDTEYAIRLTQEAGVAAIPISVFYHKPEKCSLLRFCFAKEDTTLQRAAEKLRAL